MEVKIINLKDSNFVWCNFLCLSEENFKYITWENKQAFEPFGFYAHLSRLWKLFKKGKFLDQLVESWKIVYYITLRIKMNEWDSSSVSQNDFFYRANRATLER